MLGEVLQAVINAVQRDGWLTLKDENGKTTAWCRLHKEKARYEHFQRTGK